MNALPTLAISTAPLWRLSLDDAFAVIKSVGAEGAEVLVTQSTDTQSVAHIEKTADKYALPVVAIHAPMLLLTRNVWTTDPVEKIRRTLDLARDLDVGTIVLHPPYAWQLRYSLWLVHELEEAVAGHSTVVTMENMYPVHVGRRRMAFHRYGSVESLGRFEHVTLDTSHLAVAEEDIVEAYEQLSDRVVHVHLSDNRGKGRDSHAPLGQGTLPIAEFVRALDPGRLKSIALEINPGPAADDRAKLEEILGSSLQLVRDNLKSPNPSPSGPEP